MSIFDDMNETIAQLRNISLRLHDHKEENLAINIIIDDSDEQGQIFVEIENDRGESIHIGEHTRTEDGFRKIRISTRAIIAHEKI